MNQCMNQRRNCCEYVEDRKHLLMEIMKTDFILVDLQLYLDNHPNCSVALEDFNQFSQMSKELKMQYHHMYGPLLNFGYMDSEIPWQWVEDPWPWEKKFMNAM